jgi:DNA repair exonuclease SbcCD ATPase subunit
MLTPLLQVLSRAHQAL